MLACGWLVVLCPRPVPQKPVGVFLKGSLTLALCRRKASAFSCLRTSVRAALFPPEPQEQLPQSLPFHLLFVRGPGGATAARHPPAGPRVQAGGRRAAQRRCSGRLPSVVIAILLPLVMCTDVLGKHPQRKRGSAQYPCSPMTRLSESLSGLAPRGGGSHLKSLDFGVLTRV